MNGLKIDELASDPKYHCYLGSNVWLMDDHRWAFLLWERTRSQRRRCLIHADYHWDNVDDFANSPADKRRLEGASLDEIEAIVGAGELIKYDSFIAPALRRNLFSEIHFFCKQDDGHDIAFEQKFLTDTDVRQFVHQRPEDLSLASPTSPVCFDLCLDLFNKSENWETGDLWPDSEIIGFMDTICAHIAAAELVTVSLSFGYSGSDQDTKYLASIVLPLIMSYRDGD